MRCITIHRSLWGTQQPSDPQRGSAILVHPYSIISHANADEDDADVSPIIAAFILPSTVPTAPEENAATAEGAAVVKEPIGRLSGNCNCEPVSESSGSGPFIIFTSNTPQILRQKNRTHRWQSHGGGLYSPLSHKKIKTQLPHHLRFSRMPLETSRSEIEATGLLEVFFAASCSWTETRALSDRGLIWVDGLNLRLELAAQGADLLESGREEHQDSIETLDADLLVVDVGLSDELIVGGEGGAEVFKVYV